MDLAWTDMPEGGLLMAESTLRTSFNSYFQKHLPWRIGTIKLDAGPVVLAHVHGEVRSNGVGNPGATLTSTEQGVVPADAGGPARVRMIVRTDKSGQGVFLALPEKETAHMTEDVQLRTLTRDPKSRCVLITDGCTAAGRAMVQALAAAGAAQIFVGIGADGQDCPDEVKDLPGVSRVALDLSSGPSVRELADKIAPALDILINTATFFRPGAAMEQRATETARHDMEINYFGLLRLIQAFGPVMRLRAAQEADGVCAWVNLFSVYALSNWSACGTSSASQAAAYSLSQNLRADLAGSGVKVVNVLSGPLDDDWNLSLPPPKLAPRQLADAVVGALQQGIENVTLGPVAEDIVQRFREDPMVLERELISRSAA